MRVQVNVDRIRNLIRSKITELSATSVAVAVAHNDEILWEEAFGWANREDRISADPHTMYSLASISKPITATGLMILVEKGKIDLDMPVNCYLGNAKLKAWVGDAELATVRRVANHTSGLPMHYQFFYEDENYPKPTMDETILRYGNIVSIPGERYEYSNIGYGILDYIISRTSGMSYADYMLKEVFIPLGMTRSSVNIGPGLENYHAIRYASNGARLPFYDFDHPGGSAVYCSVHDLIRFAMFHLKAHLPDQKAIISDNSIDEMQKGTAEIGNGRFYGIGWAMCNDLMGYRAVWHNGGMPGVSTTLMLLPDEKIAIAVLSNSEPFDSSSNQMLPDFIRDEILSELLPKYAERLKQHRQAMIEHASSSVETKELPMSKLEGEWNGYIHTYKGDIPLTFVFLKSGDVHVKMNGQLWTLLNDITFKDDILVGRTVGDIGTEDVNRRPYTIRFSLKLRGDVMNGSATAISLPSPRMGNALSHWTELRRS